MGIYKSSFDIEQLSEFDDTAKQAVLKYINIKLGFGGYSIINPRGSLDQLIDFYDFQLNKQLGEVGDLK